MKMKKDGMMVLLKEEDIGRVNAFEEATKTAVVDYISSEDTLYFLVKGKLGPVIGKGGENIKRLEANMGKKIKVFLYSPNIKIFVKNLVTVPVRSIAVIECRKNSDAGANENNAAATAATRQKIVRVGIEKKSRALVIGRNGKNLAVIKELLRRQFEIADVKIS